MRIPKICLDWKSIHNQKRKICLDRQTDKQTDRRILHFCLDRQILPKSDFENRVVFPNTLSISPENKFSWSIVTWGFQKCVQIENPFIVNREKFVRTDRHILHFCLDRQIFPKNDFEDGFFLPNSLSISPENNFCWSIVTRGFQKCIWNGNSFIIKREIFVWTDRQTNKWTDAHYIFVWTDKF